MPSDNELITGGPSVVEVLFTLDTDKLVELQLSGDEIIDLFSQFVWWVNKTKTKTARSYAVLRITEHDLSICLWFYKRNKKRNWFKKLFDL